MSGPAEVAKAGFEALMSGDDMVTVGFKNKVQKVISNVTPDEKLASQMHEMQEPVDERSHK